MRLDGIEKMTEDLKLSSDGSDKDKPNDDNTDEANNDDEDRKPAASVRGGRKGKNDLGERVVAFDDRISSNDDSDDDEVLNDLKTQHFTPNDEFPPDKKHKTAFANDSDKLDKQGSSACRQLTFHSNKEPSTRHIKLKNMKRALLRRLGESARRSIDLTQSSEDENDSKNSPSPVPSGVKVVINLGDALKGIKKRKRDEK